MHVTTAHPETRKESDRIRAARGFHSFQQWKQQNRKAAREHLQNGKPELAAALDREYDRYISANL